MADREYGLIIIWSRRDTAYVATCFEFPGLSARGATAEDALREAQAALELFIEDDKESGELLPEPGETLALPENPEAMSYAELVGPAQLIEIRQLGRELGVDTEAECLALIKCKVENLSRTAATVFAFHLRRKQTLMPRAA